MTAVVSTAVDDEVVYLAPDNFAMVEAGVYRSAFPRTKHIAFLERLKLKSVVSLVPEDYPLKMSEFYERNNIKLIVHGLDGNKYPFKEIDHVLLQSVLDDILNIYNRPLLIHCNKGKHRTGSVCGSLRKIRGWGLSAIFNEYLLYALPKARLEDQQLIESFVYSSSNISDGCVSTRSSGDAHEMNSDDVAVVSEDCSGFPSKPDDPERRSDA